MLADPVVVGRGTAGSRVLFGPHITNLADPRRPRAIGADHVGHYRARAAGGAGVVVTEVASVTADDHPYEYAPLAAECGPGWAAIAAPAARTGRSCSPGSGTPAGRARRRTPGVRCGRRRRCPTPRPARCRRRWTPTVSRRWSRGSRRAAAAAVAAGCDGVEVQAGQHALLRQFLSGLTNHRDDAYGADRALLLVEVLTAVRDAVGARCARRAAPDRRRAGAVGGRHAGAARAVLERVAGLVDLVVPVRGSALVGGRDAARRAHGAGVPAVGPRPECGSPGVATVLAGSVVDPDLADRRAGVGDADLVEMTRAQLADADLVALVRAAAAPRGRAC